MTDGLYALLYDVASSSQQATNARTSIVLLVAAVDAKQEEKERQLYNILVVRVLLLVLAHLSTDCWRDERCWANKARTPHVPAPPLVWDQAPSIQ